MTRLYTAQTFSPASGSSPSYLTVMWRTCGRNHLKQSVREETQTSGQPQLAHYSILLPHGRRTPLAKRYEVYRGELPIKVAKLCSYRRLESFNLPARPFLGELLRYPGRSRHPRHRFGCASEALLGHVPCPGRV